MEVNPCLEHGEAANQGAVEVETGGTGHLIQSLKAIDDLDSFFGGYGLIVVDECHHLPAVSFESYVRQAPARHFLGLTATPYRRDGLQEIITMQCGPIRHRIASSEGPAGDLTLDLRVRESNLAIPGAGETPIQEVFRLLVDNEASNPTRYALPPV